MLISKAAKVVGLGSAVFILSSRKVEAKELIACHDCRMKRLPKAKELPLYDTKEDFVAEYDKNSVLPLLSQISTVRKKVFECASYVNTAQEKAVHIYETGVAHSKGTFDYLNDEENKVQRYLIIASGGLLGLLLARNRGIIKKVLYTSVGTGITFTAFYPSVTKEYAVAGWNASKDQINPMLKEYGGYDTDKFEKEVKEKIEKVKSVMKFESVMNTLNEKFYKASKEEENKSKEANQDMYTTRSAS